VLNEKKLKSGARKRPIATSHPSLSAPAETSKKKKKKLQNLRWKSLNMEATDLLDSLSFLAMPLNVLTLLLFMRIRA
jgi:hypothetical protein